MKWCLLILKSEGDPSPGLERTSDIKGEQSSLCSHGTGRADSGLECSQSISGNLGFDGSSF